MLEANPLQLGEVVVTGAGTSTEVEKLGQRSQQRVAGADRQGERERTSFRRSRARRRTCTIAQSSGDPGAGSKITIRGLRTINGDVEPLFIIDGVPMNNTTFSTTNFNPIDAGSTTGVGGQDVGGQLEGTSAPNKHDGPQSCRHRKCGDSKGRGGGGDLRRASGERRDPHHHKAWPFGPDALLVAQLRHRMTKSRRSIRFSASTGRASAASPRAVTRSWGAASSPATHSITRTKRSIRVTNSTTRSACPAETNARRSISRATTTATRACSSGRTTFSIALPRGSTLSHHLTEGLTVGGNFSFADTRGHMTQRGNNVNGLLLGLFRTPPNFNNFP